MTGLAQLERAALCSTLTRLGPDAPTLCEGWRTRDLAAHLVIRERRPDTIAGVIVPALAEHTHRVQEQYADQPWASLVDMVRQGPRGWSPLRVPSVDDAVNLAEFFVHHEDVLRAQEDWTPGRSRQLEQDESEALWLRLRQAGQLLLRRSPVGVTLFCQGHGEKMVKAPTREGEVILHGGPGEVLLYAFGRSAVAHVEVEGSLGAIEAFAKTRFGF
ncbi:TIGR03085 family metal-binding protein [Austwickia chelonae]|uniref:TIGR03085 family metal-binding protein n=1 Tax=Austwickia chelonae TaxID=100225 RepID=UPI000E22E7AB|nr:TIGR03085 family metal-binding protein [Austwickia chelonae]